MSEMLSSGPPPRRIPPTRRLRYLAEALGFYLVIGFFKLFPIESASAFGAWIGRNFVAPTGFSKLARENLIAAYPEKTVTEVDAILCGMWDNLGRTLAEYSHLGKINTGCTNRRLTISGGENVTAALARGKGVIFVSGHLANWEVLPIAGREFGLEGASVVRPANNPYMNAWLERTRTRYGMAELVSKGAQGTRRIYSLLRKGACVCMLIDQRASEGIQVPFFARDALTTPAPAILALKMGVAIVPISNERVGGAHFHVHAHPMIEYESTGDATRDLIALTTAINYFMEEQVRAHPEQWLWIHRRWVDENAPLRKRAQALSDQVLADQALSERGTAHKAASNRV